MNAARKISPMDPAVARDAALAELTRCSERLGLLWDSTGRTDKAIERDMVRVVDVILAHRREVQS